MREERATKMQTLTATLIVSESQVRGPKDWEFAGHGLMDNLRAQAAAAVLASVLE